MYRLLLLAILLSSCGSAPRLHWPGRQSETGGSAFYRQAAAMGFAASDKGEMIKPGNYAEIEQQINAELIQWLGQAKAK